MTDLTIALERLDALRIDLAQAPGRAETEAGTTDEPALRYAREAGALCAAVRLALMDADTIRAFVAAAINELNATKEQSK